MIDGLIDAVKVLALVSLAMVVLAAVPFVIAAMVDATDAADEHIDECYWMARGYDPLDKGSTGRTER